ncbi:hypothetical protein B0H11DRAFT_2270407 [Mycena galericulata]|nr:hypothetical protein B0H11DRAFT_2300970 [Mycena galericulata]KAJ7468906.1 hypothetical protein B0H11DRAFT_2284051 [Mycena galericulata]KAJ7508791.1 hypothetical protein B0H11DRAFT_2270407 [Mycena galericulata]
MPPRSASPDELDDDLAQAMAQSSPVRPAPSLRHDKRPHAALEEGASDADEPPQTVVPSGSVNKNIVAAAQRYATNKRLRSEQKTELEVFMKDPPALREAKAYAQNLHVENLINKIVVATPPWQVSDDLNKNIYSYAAAILLSVKLSAYKGNIPKNILFAILKKHRFDLPSGIEHNPANWSKVTKAVQEAFTQLRSKFKKSISGSIKSGPTAKELLPKKERKNVFELTQIMVQNTQCEVNVHLCARVGFMRKTFIKDPSSTYWTTVDKELAKIRKKAKGDTAQIGRAFRHILKKDREEHGIDNYEIEDTVDPFQQEVDELIEGGTGTTAPAAADAGDADDDDD